MKKWLILFVAVIYQSSAFAGGIDDDTLCFFHTTKIEKQKNIKNNLLSTIALVETGRTSNNNIIGNPWPWTIAYKGKGEYFDTKEEAIEKVKKLQKQGIKSIDIGCMQVNLFYHKDAFPSLEQAFDPKTNVEYAADFVNRLYKKHGTWGAAATAYHSHNPEKAYKYEDKLIKVWAKLEKHLDNGGKLYDEPKTVQIANAFIPKTPENINKEPIIEKNNSVPVLVSMAPEINKKNNIQEAQPNKVLKFDEVYDISNADFANQWRARKLTEYRIRKESKQNPVYRSNAVRVGQNL